ncbi:hypothetical protein HGB07_07760 [Candidatus Roizmanbacteria bacterium]|nr:hypothetical protein [Candidatus Roizmanbacteria bacterium]
MMEKKIAYNIGIRYEGFRFLRFGFVEQNICIDEPLGVQFSVDIDGSSQLQEGKTQIFVKVTVLFICETAKEVVANIETVSSFGLEGVPDNFDDEGQVRYPETLLTTLVSLAISTTRGAILAKGAGSFLEKMPLPIVDPKGFVGRSPEIENPVAG